MSCPPGGGCLPGAGTKGHVVSDRNLGCGKMTWVSYSIRCTISPGIMTYLHSAPSLRWVPIAKARTCCELKQLKKGLSTARRVQDPSAMMLAPGS